MSFPSLSNIRYDQRTSAIGHCLPFHTREVRDALLREKHQLLYNR